MLVAACRCQPPPFLWRCWPVTCLAAAWHLLCLYQCPLLPLWLLVCHDSLPARCRVLCRCGCGHVRHSLRRLLLSLLQSLWRRQPYHCPSWQVEKVWERYCAGCQPCQMRIWTQAWPWPWPWPCHHRCACRCHWLQVVQEFRWQCVRTGEGVPSWQVPPRLAPHACRLGQPYSAGRRCCSQAAQATIDWCLRVWGMWVEVRWAQLRPLHGLQLVPALDQALGAVCRRGAPSPLPPP